MEQRKSKNTDLENENHMWNPLRANRTKTENQAVVTRDGGGGGGSGGGSWAETRKEHEEEDQVWGLGYDVGMVIKRIVPNKKLLTKKEFY